MTSTYQTPATRVNGALQLSASSEEASTCWLKEIGNQLRLSKRGEPESKHPFSRLPETSQERRDASLTDASLERSSLTPSDISATEEKGKTVLYLAYGSNLCNETFRGRRGINPLSQINVQVPSLRLTFDLPGIPYTEPCFSNSGPRDPESTSSADYHKDRWHKGLVGCVYEVTPSDYAHIIATEGGGASYHDILVDCYPLPDADTVPNSPSTKPFKAHTLYAPATDSSARLRIHTTSRFTRPDPSYAQPSARYLKLITDGAAELSLPAEYQKYLNDIRTYTITTKRQEMGKTLFTAIWLPFITMLFSLTAKFSDKDGKTPKWLATLASLLFTGMWMSYDGAFKKLFGDGERTEGDDAGDDTARRYMAENIDESFEKRRNARRRSDVHPVMDLV